MAEMLHDVALSCLLFMHNTKSGIELTQILYIKKTTTLQ